MSDALRTTISASSAPHGSGLTHRATIPSMTLRAKKECGMHEVSKLLALMAASICLSTVAIDTATAQTRASIAGYWRSTEGNCNRESPDGPFLIRPDGIANYHMTCATPLRQEQDGSFSYRGSCTLEEGSGGTMAITLRPLAGDRLVLQIMRGGRAFQPLHLVRCPR